MSYTPTEWATGDIVTAEKLNKLEDGVEQAIELPDTTGASNGDVLTLDNGEPTWSAPSGGGGSEELYVMFDLGAGAGTGLYTMDLNSPEPTPVPVKYGDIANRTFVVMAEMYAIPCTCIQYGDTTYALSATMTTFIGTKGLLTKYFATGELTDNVENISVESVQWTVSAYNP